MCVDRNRGFSGNDPLLHRNLPPITHFDVSRFIGQNHQPYDFTACQSSPQSKVTAFWVDHSETTYIAPWEWWFLMVQLWRRRSARCLEPFLLKAYDFCSTSPQESGVDISSCFAVHLLVIFCALTNISYSFSHAKRAVKWSAKHELKSNPDARRRVLQKSYASFRKRSKTRGEWRGLSCTRKNSPFPRCNVTTH